MSTLPVMAGFASHPVTTAVSSGTEGVGGFGIARENEAARAADAAAWVRSAAVVLTTRLGKAVQALIETGRR
jgi:hypothetical protein